MRRSILLIGILALVACSSRKPATESAPRSTRTRPDAAAATRDLEVERRIARLELRLLEKETQVEELQTRLDDARDEVVSTMAKLRNIASRAEAASAMAEADVALQQLRGMDGARALPEMTQATRLAQRSTAEFDKENYGGALYLANQAKAAAAAGRGRLAVSSRTAPRAGETPFALPVRIRVASRGNVREGPGTSFPVAFEVSPGAVLTGLAYTEDWVRVADDAGRGGWIFRSLVARP